MPECKHNIIAPEQRWTFSVSAMNVSLGVRDCDDCNWGSQFDRALRVHIFRFSRLLQKSTATTTTIYIDRAMHTANTLSLWMCTVAYTVINNAANGERKARANRVDWYWDCVCQWKRKWGKESEVKRQNWIGNCKIGQWKWTSFSTARTLNRKRTRHSSIK